MSTYGFSWLGLAPSEKLVAAYPDEVILQYWLSVRGWQGGEEGWRRPSQSTLEDRFYDLYEAVSVQLFMEREQLRRVDLAIQQANWNTEIDLDQVAMGDYEDPYVKE